MACAAVVLYHSLVSSRSNSCALRKTKVLHTQVSNSTRITVLAHGVEYQFRSSTLRKYFLCSHRLYLLTDQVGYCFKEPTCTGRKNNNRQIHLKQYRNIDKYPLATWSLLSLLSFSHRNGPLYDDHMCLIQSEYQ